MTGKDLLNSLLFEAVQGKLVPQITDEGNGLSLLEKIKEEKRLNGFTKKCNSDSSEITEEEKLFEIPNTWCWCRLGDIANKITDGTHKTPLYKKEGVKFVSAKNVYNGFLTFDNCKYISEKEHKELYKKCNPEFNDLLISKSGSIGTAVLNKNDFEFSLFESLALVKYNQKLLNCDFLKYFVQFMCLKLTQNEIKGITVKHLPIDTIKQMPFPLPPLREQARIVTGIEKFLPIIQEYDKKQEELNELNKSISFVSQKAILQEAVKGKLVNQIDKEGNSESIIDTLKEKKKKAILEGKIKKEKPIEELTEEDFPFDIPDSWRWIRLSDACNMYTGDSINETEKKLNYTNIPEGRFYIGTKDVGFDKQINYDNGVKIPYDKTNFSVAPKDSVLLCIEGGSAGRKIAFTEHDVCFGNKLCCFDSYEPELRQFIYYYLQSPMFTNAFRNNITGIIGGVSIGKLKAMPLPIPPMEEQKRIVAAIEKLLPLCEKLGR